jgi:phospholipid/cholesterol/gamma-HCH transport system substrate-binding protein
MRGKLVVAGLAAAAITAVAVVLASGGGRPPYALVIRLADASGIESGAPVTIGGVQAGTVSAVELAAGDRVRLNLSLDRAHAPVGRDVAAAIATTDLLGGKQVDLSIGNRDDPAPSGYVIPAQRVTVATDLDRVLAVLAPDTRARLSLLLNEAGTALVGRKQDFGHLLGVLPHDIGDATTLLSQLVSNNQTLGSVLQNTGQFVARAAQRRRELTRMINVLGRTAGVIDTRQVALQQTLVRAPATLASLQGFLTKLDAATVPLGPAARELAAAAPPLHLTLGRLAPFAHAADPTLRTATQVAPDLTRLAQRVTPVLRRAQPTLASVTALSTQALPTIGMTLDGSVDNILAVLENWSRAIQLRDGLSHVFRGEASLTPDVLTSLIKTLLHTNVSLAAAGRGRAPEQASNHVPAALAAAPSGSATRHPATPQRRSLTSATCSSTWSGHEALGPDCSPEQTPARHARRGADDRPWHRGAGRRGGVRCARG